MSRKTFFCIFLLEISLFFQTVPALGVTVGFDDIVLPESGYTQGPGGHVSGNVYFPNKFTNFDYYYLWEDWGVSRLITQTPPDYSDTELYFASIFPEREMSAMSNSGAGGGVGGSANYGINYVTSPPFGKGYSSVTFQRPVELETLYLTNTNYAYHTILGGDLFNLAKIFGGVSGNDPDYFYVTITGKDIAGNNTGSIDYYLADYRFENNTLDYAVSDWQSVNLGSLGSNVKSLEFRLTTSDTRTVYVPGYGTTIQPNTPFYFAMDSLKLVGNPFGPSWNGGGANNLMSNAANWGGAAPVSGQSMVFDGTTNLNPNNDINPATTAFGAITFGSQAGEFTLGGNSVKLQYDVANYSGNAQTVNTPIILVGGNQSIFAAKGDITIGGAISESGGSFGIKKTGDYALILAAANTYTGDTKIEAGTLTLIDGGDISTESDISIASGASLKITSGDHALGAISGEGDLSIGDGVDPATLTADSIKVNSLTIAAGAKVVLRPRNYFRPMAGKENLTSVPEPNSIVLVAMAALGLLIWKARRTVRD